MYQRRNCLEQPICSSKVPISVAEPLAPVSWQRFLELEKHWNELVKMIRVLDFGPKRVDG